jgi:ABC-type uncharacterized transport system permease subunit
MTESQAPSVTSTSDQPPPSADRSVTGAVRRQLLNSLRGILLPIGAILVALVISGLILLVAGYDPLEAFQVMWEGAFGDMRTISEVLLKATPLILIGIGLAVAFRCSIWNIGAEGQFYLGAVFSAIVGIYLGNLPAVILIPLLLILGAVGGALWAMLAGYLKVRFGASEIVTTIMLNYIAIIGTGYLVTGPLIEEVGKFPQTARIAEAAWLPRFLPPTRLHIGFIIAVVLAVLIYLLIFKTSTGYAIRAVGINPEAARYAGMSVERNIMLAMAVSGGAAGLAGAVEVSGLTYRLYQQISPGYGFTAIAVALLANNNPVGVIFTGILFGALSSGSEVMQMNAKVPSVLVFAIQGIVILSVVAFGAYRIYTSRGE